MTLIHYISQYLLKSVAIDGVSGVYKILYIDARWQHCLATNVNWRLLDLYLWSGVERPRHG